MLIVGDTENQVAKAVSIIERMLFADDSTLKQMKQEQMIIHARMKNEQIQTQSGRNDNIDLSLTTPYGPPGNFKPLKLR